MNDIGNVQSVNDLVEQLSSDLKLGKLTGFYTIARKTVKVLERVVTETRWTSAEELLTILKKAGKELIEAQPTETAVGNMVRRCLKLVRDEYSTAHGQHTEGEDSLHKMFFDEGQGDDYRKAFPNLKEAIVDCLGELASELETSTVNIVTQSLQQIHSDEVIMTMGGSKTVEAFLKHASRNRKFQVIVAECAPFYHGQELAKILAEASIETTLIPDSAIFAIMSRVNKVIIGTNSVMANGGLRAQSGTHALALAAKHCSVPLIVCASLYKLTPEYLCSYDQDAFNKFVSPEEVLGYSSDLISKVQAYSPVYDYVPPDLVTLFISNIGGNSPSYVYRLLSELYHPDDYEI